MALPVIKVSEVPSVAAIHSFGSIERMNRQEELRDYLSDSFKSLGSSYFGSTYDKYRDTFASTMRRYVHAADSAISRVRNALSLTSQENVIRLCNTSGPLRRLPPVMYNFILSIPELHRLHKLGRVQGYADIDPAEITREMVKDHRRLFEQNGTVQVVEGKTKKSCISWVWKTTDPELTARDLLDIDLTRDYVNSILNLTEVDPTDMDEVRS